MDLHPDGGVLVVPGEDRVGLAALIHKKDEKPFKSGPVEKKFSLIEHRSPLFEGRRPSKKGAHLYKLWRGHARSYSTRGAVLLGDAVHVINPVMAQGMTMAIEDAAALADFVGPVLASNGGAAQIDKSFEDYEAFRRPSVQSGRHSSLALDELSIRNKWRSGRRDRLSGAPHSGLFPLRTHTGTRLGLFRPQPRIRRLTP